MNLLEDLQPTVECLDKKEMPMKKKSYQSRSIKVVPVPQAFGKVSNRLNHMLPPIKSSLSVFLHSAVLYVTAVVLPPKVILLTSKDLEVLSHDYNRNLEII